MDTLRYPTPDALMDDTCNAIREKDGTSEKIPHQDVPDRIRAIPSGGNSVDLSGITAKKENVSETVKFMDASGKLDYGSMPEIADDTVTLDGTAMEHTIPEGHHSGSGKVKIVSDTANAFTPTKEQQTISPADGKVFTKVILNPIPDIYTDVSGAGAVPENVRKGITFVGKKKSVETGTMAERSGSQMTTTSNGTKYIPEGYHDGTSYIYVNVPSQVVSGENSSGTTAVAADVRKGKTCRSNGSYVTGTMPDIGFPAISVEIDKNYSNSLALIKANSTAKESGYLEKGLTGAGTAYMQKYTGSTTITPTNSNQTLQTAGKYCSENIVVGAVQQDETERAYVVQYTYTGTGSITIPLSSFSAYSPSAFLRMYVHCNEERDSYFVVSSYHYITSSHQVLTYYQAYSGEYRVDHSPDIEVEFGPTSITLDSNNNYYFNGTYEICVVCRV